MADSAVIVNEFGEVGLDHLLYEAVRGEVVVMSSGCVCCTMRSDLEDTLRGLLARRDRGEVPAFRRALVETTGLADPAPIVQRWLARLRRAHGENLLRVKGILNLVGERAPVAIHGVHHVFHPPVLLSAWPDADRRSRIVFITRGIDRTEIEAK